jgi:hypothetical protein
MELSHVEFKRLRASGRSSGSSRIIELTMSKNCTLSDLDIPGFLQRVSRGISGKVRGINNLPSEHELAHT